MINEIKAYLSYSGKERRNPLSYWRSTSGFEVDALIGSEIAIELKTSKKLIPRDLRGLKAFSEESIAKKYIVVCREERKRLVDDLFLVYPWKEFLEDLWNNRII